MSEHTKEPWKVTVADHNGQYGVWITDGSRCIAEGLSLQDASRIIACVNACAGMADPVAEIEALRGRAENAEAEAKQLREELSHSILEATAQLVNAKADALVRAEKAEAALKKIDEGFCHHRLTIKQAQAIIREALAGKGK